MCLAHTRSNQNTDYTSALTDIRLIDIFWLVLCRYARRFDLQIHAVRSVIRMPSVSVAGFRSAERECHEESIQQTEDSTAKKEMPLLGGDPSHFHTYKH